MTSTKQKRGVWKQQFYDQTGRPRLISSGDITYVLASLFLGGMQLLPASRRIRVINKTCALLAGILHAANVNSTQTIRQNMKTLFDQGRPPDAMERDIRSLLSITVWNSLIMHTLPVLPPQQIVDLVPVDGTSHLDDYLAGGHPVLIWGYHFGVHPLIVAAILHARGYPIHAVTHVRHMPATASIFQRRYLSRLRPIGDRFSVINPREGVQRKMLDVLRNKDCLYVTPDYMVPDDERQTKSAFEVAIDFLDRKAYLQAGGLRLAKRLGAKVLAVLSTQDEKNQRRLVVEPFQLPTPGLTPTDLQHDLHMCMRRLEVQVLAHPHLWWDLKRDDLLLRLRAASHDP
jgi:lauroyl/myristoyl acyltransferase